MQGTPTGSIIVGAGPAGLGMLVAACNAGLLDQLFASGVAILEKHDAIGAGGLGAYAINSDSHADTLLRCLDGSLAERCPELPAHPATRALRHYRGRAAPLHTAAGFAAALGRAMQAVAAAQGQPILTGMDVLDATRVERGWSVRARRIADGSEVRITAPHLVVATGAAQSASSLHSLAVAGGTLWPRYRDRLMLSHTLLGRQGLAVAQQRLGSLACPRAAIVGGSHSAMSAAAALLRLDLPWKPESIAILHRSPLRPMYPSPDLARADGFDDFGAADICPKTGRVFPLAGFRSDSRELLLHVLGLGGRAREERIRLVDLRRPDHQEAADSLGGAGLIVAATGYRPRGLTLFDGDGRRIRLLSETSASAAMVDERSRLLCASGQAIPGVFGIGLSAGFPLAGTHGEPSFRGQANGLALWQSEIGAAIVRQILDDGVDHPQPPVARRMPREAAGLAA